MKTVTLILAKQLKEAGFPQAQSDWYWFARLTAEHAIAEWYIVYETAQDEGYRSQYRSIAAPTADEILEQLPEYVLDEQRDMARVSSGRWNKNYWIEYHCSFNPPVKRIIGESLADAAAKMWLYLKENHLLKETKQEKSEEG